ncbi:DHA2 family efflux MFS transporter permease subunit [Ornithinicoccus hortensis]|uniref:EmrB/QacA subfamily drug resistance transporter n=1 Tax=Ornithinicoccus hortensis TaxID=82346 RepID=A0A542YWK3_9MICO|nr:DHA2 family efflux MFS transporter permease subunit [Ornithinicoccus hortensis]TQL52462.1 EmrB/QacA subfamily drug resistance transporter [Ornithinicoccus hortensis]
MTQTDPTRTTDLTDDRNPWPALWALVIGFFMILVDSTIVSVAVPAIMTGLGAGVTEVIWVTSAYLLAYAVPLLITGRLGDRFGPKTIYLVGLTVFTLASLWCGLTGTVEELIVARAVQGLGASMMTPQTMAVITRTFPAARRGGAMALWGATAGIATLVGPVLGGVLVDGPGWEWIFFVNVPVGVVAFVLAARLVPQLPTHTHSFDWVGVILSAVAMFLLVFGIQEGESYDWGTITGIVSVPLLIGAGVLALALAVGWWAVMRREPLVPLGLFRDRNFSLANGGISLVSFAVTGMAFPFMLWAQVVHGYSPTRAGLLLVPMAVASFVLAPVVGRLVDRMHPRGLSAFGFLGAAAAMFWLSRAMGPDTQVWQIMAPIGLFGVASAFLWAPLGTTATRNLPLDAAGAGSGVYNATRQVGAVLGSAAIAAVIETRLVAHLGPVAESAGAGGAPAQGMGGALPPQIAAGYSDAMADAMLVPAAALALGVLIAVAFARPAHFGQPAPRG